MNFARRKCSQRGTRTFPEEEEVEEGLEVVEEEEDLEEEEGIR